MPTVKCDNCGHSVEVEDATKRYRLPLFFIFLGTTVLVFQHAFNKPSLILTILGGAVSCSITFFVGGETMLLFKHLSNRVAFVYKLGN